MRSAEKDDLADEAHRPVMVRSSSFATEHREALDRERPILSGKDIICISSIDWDFNWQGHQEIMATFAEHGNRVLFMENTGVRPPTLRDLPRLKRRLLNWKRGTGGGFRQERPGLFVYSPLILPFPYSWIARRLNLLLLRKTLRAWMQVTYFQRPIIWTYLPTPLARDLIRELDPELTVYYCVGDLASSSHAARRIAASEHKLFREADLVFVISDAIRKRVTPHTSRAHLLPSGVALRRFEHVRNSSAELPADIRSIPRPIVGYLGGLHKWVDLDLLAEVARKLPNMSFVFVGPEQTDASKLAAYSNVHLLGARRHNEVPSYIKAFDVGLIPYVLAEYTDTVYPAKMAEYLAMGIPVVASDLPSIRDFNAEFGEVIQIANGAEEFATEIESAVTRHTSEEMQRRLEVARLNSWESFIADASQLMRDAIELRKATEARWEESLRRLYRLARRRILRTALSILIVLALLFYSSFLRMLAEPLRISDSPQTADAIVVFAGGVGESGRPGAGYQERVRHAIDLYKTGKAPVMVFTSGSAPAFEETEVMKLLALANGVPESAIILEKESASTYEYVTNVNLILRQRGWRSILLVTSPYRMRRAMWTWRKAAPEVAVTAAPIPYSQFYDHGIGASSEQIGGIAHEYLSLVMYWWQGKV